MRTYLKIKIKSLATEASFIKLDERKAKAAYRGYAARQTSAARALNPEAKKVAAAPSALFWDLKHHRLDVVRFECRAANLAYGFIRGRSYKQLEAKTHPMWDHIENRLWARVVSLAAKYGAGTATADTIAAWRDAE